MQDPTDTWVDPNTIQLPEAPSVANIRVWIDDYGVMFTIRGKEMLDIVTKTLQLIETAKKKGWKSTWTSIPSSPTGSEPFRGNTVAAAGPQTTITKTCEPHGAQMTEKISKKTGKKYFSHMQDGNICFGH